MNKFDLVEDAIEDILKGKMVIVADDESRENEGDFVCAAEMVTPEIISFMINHGRGLVCAPITDQRARELELPLMLEKNTEYTGCSFLVSVDADPAFGVTTGISAQDRATTIRLLLDEERRPADFRRPGHVFPLRARDGGVLERNGQTEASVDLARLAGLKPAGVICEIIREDGFMARRDELFLIARKYNMRFITVAQMQTYMLRENNLWARSDCQPGMAYLGRPAVI
ncbi:MAG TPA: 3,4-dihydroxy-2-butanone-4-phosphate synthase [Acidiferrobacterales bacterium]|nr:3,4-dihydroxy-2-butanone-4-phosphate synthase [Acidiferrobacterales bacterium]